MSTAPAVLSSSRKVAIPARRMRSSEGVSGSDAALSTFDRALVRLLT
ncbi:hypothetical protein QNO07_12180 [Streptomyces sp. 549]|nr:hypothetical protein [Streptomyces sp. 549]MDK1474164.1 hypothetical protein [Streptomyces sp. 549]